MDLDTLYQDILLALSSDPIATKHTSTDSWWSMDPNSLLFLDNRIYVWFASNLHTYVLQYSTIIITSLPDILIKTKH